MTGTVTHARMWPNGVSIGPVVAEKSERLVVLSSVLIISHRKVTWGLNLSLTEKELSGRISVEGLMGRAGKGHRASGRVRRAMCWAYGWAGPVAWPGSIPHILAPETKVTVCAQTVAARWAGCCWAPVYPSGWVGQTLTFSLGKQTGKPTSLGCIFLSVITYSLADVGRVGVWQWLQGWVVGVWLGWLAGRWAVQWAGSGLWAVGRPAGGLCTGLIAPQGQVSETSRCHRGSRCTLALHNGGNLGMTFKSWKVLDAIGQVAVLLEYPMDPHCFPLSYLLIGHNLQTCQWCCGVGMPCWYNVAHIRLVGCGWPRAVPEKVKSGKVLDAIGNFAHTLYWCYRHCHRSTSLISMVDILDSHVCWIIAPQANLISLQCAYTLCLQYGTHPVSMPCLCIPLQPLHSLFIGIDSDPYVPALVACQKQSWKAGTKNQMKGSEGIHEGGVW
ncbi:uncharacterized protein MONOS_18502 [Monocercomonoides exilis]|uniref:uncharacterized protein n=1 Tax=Monocercomonoides exilis TaxID=2049356 RepID=UPI00355A0531|nr:hypothetical protein MONOS_18502 [Monocercomonoides exilis]